MSLINDALKRAKQTHRQQTVTPDLVAVTAMPPLQPVEDTPDRGALSSGSKRLLLLVPLLCVMGGVGAWFLWQWSTSGKATVSPAISSASTSVAPVAGGKKNPLQITAATVAQVVARAQTEPAPESVGPVTIVPTPKTQTPTAPAETVTAVAAPAPTVGITPVAVFSTVPTDAVPSTAVSPGTTSPNAVASPETVPLFAQPARTPTPIPPPALAPPAFKLQGIFFRVKNPTALINDRIVSIGETIDGYRVVQIERQSVKLSVPNYTNIVTLH